MIVFCTLSLSEAPGQLTNALMHSGAAWRWLPAVSTYETDLAVLGREDFWLIVAFRGSEDETEIHSG